MAKWRYTVNTISSGQPRPYADHTNHCRVLIEWQGMEGFKDSNAPFVPSVMDDNAAKALIKRLVGWVDKGEGDWASTRLTRFEKVGPGEWEVITRAANTD